MPSLPLRVAFYMALAAITVAGFVPVVAVFALFFPIGLIFLASAFLVVYLPLLDWPWLVWRRTGKLALVLLAVAAALIPAVVVPLGFNASQQRLAEQDKGASREKTLLPAAPIPAREILISKNDYFFKRAQACGDHCRALLESGAVDHVLVTGRMDGDHLGHALLFTLEKMPVCSDSEFGRENSQRGWCFVWREVSDPHFDAIIQEWGPYEDRELTLFAGQGGPKAERGDVWVFDCRTLCKKILLVHPAEAQRLAFPVYPVFAFGLDSGGPFGLRYSTRPLVTHPAAEVIQAAFGMDVTGFHPRPSFAAGDIAHGGPLLPTAKYFRDLEQQKREQEIAADQEKLRALERPLEIYREKLRALRAQHADCASPIISPGPEPQYQGCSNQPPSTVPTFSQLQQRLNRH
jgi:hypothetical protein